MAKTIVKTENYPDGDVTVFSKSADISRIEFVSHGDVRIDGSIKGSIRTPGKLIVGENGHFEGDAVCGKADIFGVFNGTLNIATVTSILGVASFTGELRTGRLAVESDVRFNATCMMLQEEECEKLKETLSSSISGDVKPES